MDGEGWKNDSKDHFNGHDNGVGSVLHIPRVVLEECLTDFPCS